MQDLTLVGVHDDGEHLVLSGPDGQRFRVRVDEPLRAAVRRDRARLGQLQIEMDGKLRPRDIQARIRAGQTAEEIAEASGLPVEHIRRYEGPVLAEREFVVRQARLVRIRRPGNPPGASPTLGDLVAERLAAREVPESETTWDAWRSEDGQWVLALTFVAGTKQRQARWTYDASLRHVAAVDDEARWLTEDEPPAQSNLLPQGRRLVPIRSADPLRGNDSAVRDRVYDVEADGGVRPVDDDAAAAMALHPSSQPHPAGQSRPVAPSEPAAPAAAATVDLLDSLRERRGRRQRLALPGEEDLDPFETAGAADPFLLNEPPAAHPPRSRPDLAVDAEVLVLPDVAPLPSREREPAPPAAQPAPAQPAAQPAPAQPVVPAAPAASTTPPAGQSPGGATPASRRGKRASVPSWDDIVFGSRRD